MKIEECMYYWKDNQVVKEPYDKVGDFPLHCYTIDADHGYVKYRYGMWINEDSTWKHIPFEEFPAEFRTQLLLLGIS